MTAQAPQLRVVQGERTERVPPHDLGAEAAVLSAVLFDPNEIRAVASFLRPEAFYSGAHRHIYAAILALAEAGAPIDTVAVLSELRARQRLEQIGGSPYLTSILDAADRTQHAVAYATTVHETWRARQGIAICQEYAARGYLDYGTSQDYLDAATRELAAIGRLGLAPAAESNGQVLTRIVRRISETAAGAGKRPAGVTGLATGLASYDEWTAGLHAAHLTVWAARPGRGKTALALQTAANVARVGIAVVFFETEMTREELLQRLVGWEAAVDGTRLKTGQLTIDEWNRVTDAAARIATWPLWIDDTSEVHIGQIQARCYAALERGRVEKVPVGLVVIDYLQRLAPLPELARSDERIQIAGSAKGAKSLAKELKLPVLALAQLNQNVDQRTGAIGRPKLKDIYGSSRIGMEADNVAFIHLDGVMKGNREVFIDPRRPSLVGVKQRGGAESRDMPLIFEPEYGRFTSYREGPGEWGGDRKWAGP